MPGAISGLGAFAGGLDDTLGPQLQQYKQDQAIGQGIYALAGVPAPQQQSPLGSLGSGIQSLLGGGGAAPNTPALPPAAGQGGVAQSPISGLSPGQPMNPSAGQTAPVASPQPPAAAQPPPSQPQQTAQLSPQVQQQQQSPKGPDLSAHNGMYDFPTLIRALTARGMPPAQLGRVVRSPAFEAMMNNVGLQQYRALNLAERYYGVDSANQRSDDRLNAMQDKFAQNERDRLRREELARQGHALDRQEQQIERMYTQQSGRLMFLPQADQKAAAAELDKKYNEQMDEINKRRDALDKEDASVGQSAESSPRAASEEDIGHDPKTGKMLKYKGSGDRKDLKNWEPLSSLNTGKAGKYTALADAGDKGGTWYSKRELSGSGLQTLMDNAEGDDDLGKIVHSLQHWNAMVPSTLRGVAPIAPEQ